MGNLLNSSSTDAGLLDDKVDYSRSHVQVYRTTSLFPSVIDLDLVLDILT